jgi:hypothetical protein
MAIEDKDALAPARERFATEIQRTSAYLGGLWRALEVREP